MIRNFILLSVIVVLNFFFWLGKSMSYSHKPDLLYDLEGEQVKVNEKYITAQILSQSLTNVYSVFKENLASEVNDEKNEDASLPFLENLTDILNKLEIRILEIRPKAKEEYNFYTTIPYSLEIFCEYEKFGKFVTELEKNNRLIVIDEFILHNGIERISGAITPEELIQQRIEMTISTITLNKAKS